MKAITVWQPWATLLATGQKHNETRSWKTSYRGEILIHAAKTDHSGILLYIPMEELKHFQDAGVVNKLPTGAIIGKANLVDCFQIDEAYRRKLQRENPAELAFGDYTICRKYTHEVIEGKGTDHEYTHASCDGCPFNVEKFGEHKICGCILSAPDDWDEPKVIGHIVRTIIHEMAGGKK